MDSSLVKDSAGSNAGDIWHRHESEIRLLYQTKSLKEVKDIMETKHGFPRLALEDPSRKRGDKKLKKTKRRTEVIVGNRIFTWDQAWRNMKHAGAIVGLQLDPPSPLPPDITVRTPPTAQSPPSPHMSLNTLHLRDEFTSAIQPQDPSCSYSGLIRKGNTDSSHGGMFIQQYHLLMSSKNPLPLNYRSLVDHLKARVAVHLRRLPIWKLSNTLVELADELADLDPLSQKSSWEHWRNTTAALTPQTTSSIEIADISQTETSDQSAIHPSDLFSCLTIMQPSSTLATFSTRHRAYLTVSVAIYLLSNNLVDLEFLSQPSDHRGFFETLDLAFAEIPTSHLRALLQSRLASVRAAFEALVFISGMLKQQFAFKSLVDIGVGNHWLAVSAQGHQHLCHAVCMDLDGVVQQLLRIRCRPEKFVWFAHYRTTAIIEALKRHNIQCARLLLKHCDVNSQFSFFPYHSITSFTFFIKEMYYLDGMMCEHGVKLFLDAGADINSLLEVDRDILPDYHPTWSVSDYLFCFFPLLFDKFAPSQSFSEVSKPTRVGILTSLKNGPNTLNEYCNRLAQHIGWECLYEYLELLVIEQLTGIGPWHGRPYSKADLNAVYALVGLGISMNRVLRRAPRVLANCIRGDTICNKQERDMDVIQFLLDNGAIVDELSLEEAVRLGNNDLVTLLTQKSTNIQQQGPHAVMMAAFTNNFEAVKMLLDAGVDINTELANYTGSKCGPDTTSMLCQIIDSWRGSFEDLNNMVNFLVQRGAHFRLSATKPRLSDMVEFVLRSQNSNRDEGLLLKMVQLIIDAGCDLSDPDIPSARLLEACGCVGGHSHSNYERMEIFEFIYRKGALLRPGAPLASWIGIGGGVELVEEMLCAGVDIDAYHDSKGTVRTALQAAAEQCSEELVVLLLQRGAAVNERARGQSGRTALQAICNYDPQSPEEKARQVSVINILLAYGANVNAAPARRWGCTSLQTAAEHGNLEVAMLLLSCNPPADVNMPPSQHPFRHDNALDLASREGRLDMVTLLLNNNALSGCPGDTAYDGAIRAAEGQGHLAVADLIREHVATLLRSNAWHENLSQPQRDWREYGYDNYSEGYTTVSEYGDDDEDDESSESEDDESSDSGDDEDPLAQTHIQSEVTENTGFEHTAPEPGFVWDMEIDEVAQIQIQDEVVEHPGFEHTAPEPGFVWDMEIDEPLDFDLGFSNLGDNMESRYGLDYAPSDYNIDTAAPGWGFGQ